MPFLSTCRTLPSMDRDLAAGHTEKYGRLKNMAVKAIMRYMHWEDRRFDAPDVSGWNKRIR